MIREYICSRGYEFVMREYQNDISFTTYRYFEMNKAAMFTVENDGFWVTDHRVDEGIRHVRWEDLTGVSIYHDWAGGRDGEKNDFAAIVMIAWTKRIEGVTIQDDADNFNGQYGYVLNAKLERVPLPRQIEFMFDMAEEAMDTLIRVPNLSIKMGYEEIIDGIGSANKLYKQMFMREQQKRGEQFDKLRIQAITQARINKLDRIDTLAGPINFGWLAFHEHLPNEFISQLSQYPVADHDDGPDALEGATKRQLRPATPKTPQRLPDFDEAEFEYGESKGLKLGGSW